MLKMEPKFSAGPLLKRCATAPNHVRIEEGGKFVKEHGIRVAFSFCFVIRGLRRNPRNREGIKLYSERRSVTFDFFEHQEEEKKLYEKAEPRNSSTPNNINQYYAHKMREE